MTYGPNGRLAKLIHRHEGALPAAGLIVEALTAEKAGMEFVALWCTAPRVALLAALTTANMLMLVVWADLPMVSALQVAAALQEATPERPLSSRCPPLALLGGEKPVHGFDGRKSGYGYREAETILCAMEANNGFGRRMYLERHFPSDMVFPVLYGLTLAAMFLFLLGHYGWATRRIHYFVLAPLAAAGLDIMENIAVRALVLSGPPPDASLVQIASALTTAKYGLVLTSFSVILGMLVWYLVVQSLRATQPLQ